MSKPKESKLYLHAVVEEIAAIIDVDKRKITNRELLKLNGAYGIESLSTDPHLCHEIAETALNHLIRTRYGKPLLDSSDPAAACSKHFARCRHVFRPKLGEVPRR
jgi:hypothetical protein